MDEQRIN